MIATVPWLRRAGVLLAVATLFCACARGASNVPPWMQLRVGTAARLGYSHDDDPEHALLFASADAAYAALATPGVAQTHAAPAGTDVVITAIDARSTAGRHIVEVHAANVDGWAIAEDVLLPIPPDGTVFTVPNAVDGKPSMLYQEADDDDGVPFAGDAHVTYESFSANPGNPEYQVHVDDGTLGGRDGYVLASELQSPVTHGFRLVAPS